MSFSLSHKSLIKLPTTLQSDVWTLLEGPLGQIIFV